MRPAVALGCLAAVLGCAWAAAPGAEVPDVLGGFLDRDDAAEHHARGEIRHGDQWVSITALFEDYRRARAEMEGLADSARSARQELEGLTQEFHRARGDWMAQERPVRAELGEARAKLDFCRRVLNSSPPQQPRYLPDPPKPKGNDEEAKRRYEQRKKEVKAENDRRKERYEQAKDAFKRYQDQAKREAPALEKKVDELDARLESLRTAYQQRVRPLTDQRQAIEDRLAAIQRDSGAALARVKAIAASLEAAPEDLRLKHGICAWTGVYYSVEEVEALLAEKTAEIDHARDELRSRLAQRGQDLPSGWRHAGQDEADALKALLDRATAARGR